MRWNIHGTPIYGDERTVTRFAFWPKRIGAEWVWLEVYHTRQVYTKYYDQSNCPGGFWSYMKSW